MPVIKTRRTLLLASLGALSLAATGCGFRMRGPRPLAFDSLYVSSGLNTPIGAELRRQILTSGTTTITEDPAAAHARLDIMRNARGREILSLSGAGTVREYQLTQSITFRVTDRAGVERLPPTTISARREYNFDDTQVIAKQQEEKLLYDDMERDLLMQLMRRLAAIES